MMEPLLCAAIVAVTQNGLTSWLVDFGGWLAGGGATIVA